MRYQEFPPAPSLASIVKRFWLLEDAPAHIAPIGPLDAVVLDVCPEIIVHYGDRFTEDAAGRRRVQSDVIASGQLTGPLMLRPTGRVDMLAARFPAGGLFSVLAACPCTNWWAGESR